MDYFSIEGAAKIISAIAKPSKREIELEVENKQLKEQNEKEFADYTKFKQEQYDEYLERSNKLIKEKQHYKHIIDELEKWLEGIKTNIEELTIDFQEWGHPAQPSIVIEEVLSKLQELKGSDNNV